MALGHLGAKLLLVLFAALLVLFAGKATFKMTRAVRAMLVQLLCIAVASAVALTPIKVQSLSAFAQSRAVAHQVGRTAVYVASENIIRVTHDPSDAPT